MKLSAVTGEGLWVLTGQVLSALAMLLNVRILTEYLDPAEVGLMTLLVGGASTLMIISVGPLTQSILVSFAHHHQEHQKTEFLVVARGLVLRAATWGMMAICALTLVPVSLGAVHPATPLLLSGLFFVDASKTYAITRFSSERRQRAAALVYAGDALLRLAFVWSMLHLVDANAYVAIAGQAVGGAVMISAVGIWRTGGHSSRNIEGAQVQAIRHSLLTIAKPLYPAVLLNNLTDMGGRYYVASLVGLGDAGIFSLSYGIVKRPFGMLNAITDWTMKPVLSEAIAHRQQERVIQIRRWWLGGGAAAALTGALLFFLLGDWVVSILLAPEYREAAEVVGWIALGVATFNIANILNAFSLTQGDSRASLVTSVVGAGASVVVSIALIWRFGLPGAAWAMPCYYALQLVTAALMFSKRKGVWSHPRTEEAP